MNYKKSCRIFWKPQIELKIITKIKMRKFQNYEIETLKREWAKDLDK